jgi:nitrite reductase (NO-forming)
MHNKKNRITFWLLIAGLLVFACTKNVETNQLQNSDTLGALKNEKIAKLSPKDTIAGKKVYESKCLVCHQQNGEGVPGIYPPLANADYLLADKKRALHQIIHGVSDSITVNGVKYRGGIMPDIEMTNEQIKDVTNYILNSWGNHAGIITMEDIKELK